MTSSPIPPNIMQTAKEGWWHRATTEQRLAQIAGGVECNMTARQIGMASGVPARTIHASAQYHGISIPVPRRRSASGRRVDGLVVARGKYFRGEALTSPEPEFRLDDVEAAL